MAADPNNTKWTKDETTFGQKILRAHGWQPGQYLGAQDASHASLHSAASSAPIKVVLKDDTLGLGAKVRQKQSDQCTGLDVFKDLLGRLNGESDESIGKKQAARSELKTSLYVERKFGPMRFVKGGLLVGDQITELVNKTADVKQTAANVPSETTETGADDQGAKPKKEKKEKKSKKRKAEESDNMSDSEAEREERKKKKKRSKDGAPTDPSPSESTSDSEKKRRKKDKKDKKSKKADTEDTDGASDTKSKKKKDKKKRKDDSAAAVAQPDDEDSERSKKKKKKKRKDKEATDASDSATETTTSSATGSGTSTPTGTGTSTPQPLGRALVRSRYLASKRSAIADMQALNQVCFPPSELICPNANCPLDSICKACLSRLNRYPLYNIFTGKCSSQ